MSQAEALYHLQTIDLTLAQRQQRLKAIAAVLNDSHLVAEAQKQVNTAQGVLNPLRTQTRNLELELQSNVTKTQVTEEQLYSGRVRNPKEMQDMQQEIGALKKRHGELEDKLLSLMMDVEAAEAVLADSESQLKQAQSTQGTQQTDLLTEQAALQAEVKALQTQRTEATTHIEPENLKIYTTMRSKKIPEPISVLKGSTCTFCGVEDTMAVAQQVRQGQKLVFCTNCERILVYLG